MKKLELNKQEEFTLRAILSTINEMGNLQKICKDDNATEEALVSLCEKVFDGMDEFMKTKGFSPESSDRRHAAAPDHERAHLGGSHG